MRKLAQIIFLSFLFVIGVAAINPVRAATLTRQVTETVEILNDASALVTEEHTLSWDDYSNYFPASRNFILVSISPALASQESAVEQYVSAITVKNREGTDIAFEKKVDNGEIILKIPYYDDLRSSNTLRFVITYKSTLYAVFEGKALDITIPGLPKDFVATRTANGITDVTTFSLQLKIPLSFGKVTSVAPIPGRQQETSNVTIIGYSGELLVGNTVRATVGNNRFIKFSLQGKTYPTNTTAPEFVKGVLVNYIEVALPSQKEGAESANQIILYSRIEPFPESLRTDDDGNVIARIPVSATTEGNILIEGYAQVGAVPLVAGYDAATISQIPDGMLRFLAPEDRYWQSNNQLIVEKAVLLKQDTISQSVKQTIQLVSSTLSYTSVTSGSQLVRKGAVAALEQKNGVCMEYSDLTIALLRAQGIPARAVYGDGIGSRVDRTLAGIGHQWVGVWIPGSGWVPIDPTWSDKTRTYVGHDMDHFVWYVASKNPNEPSGFNCESSDSSQPCRDSLEIYTEPVETTPERSQLFSIDELTQKIADKDKEVSGVQRTLQNIVSYLGASAVGRVILSTQGLIITFAIVLYSVLVVIVTIVSRKIRKRPVR